MKLAVICAGRAQLEDEAPLTFIGDSVKRVLETLENHGWKTVPYQNAKSVEDFKNLFTDYHDSKIDDFLFYYIGHGYGNNIDTFQIYFKEHPLTIEQIMKDAIKGALGYYPKNMALVLDACYSGRAIDTKSSVKDTEVLTASGRDREAFEKIMPDNQGWSEFSFYFCEAFQTEHESNTLNLEQIGKYISAPEQTNEETFYLPNPSSLTNKIIVGYTQKITNIKNKIKAFYQNKFDTEQKQITAFKYDILRFYPRVKEKMYNEVRNSKNMDDLFALLIKDEKSSYLYCILKYLEIDDPYIDNFKGQKECREISTLIESVMVVVESNSNNNKYTADIYYGLDNGMVEHNEYLKENDWEELYKVDIQKVLEKTLALNCKPKMELQFILPIKLMKSDFKNQRVEIGEVEGITCDDAWGRKFNITTKFHSHLKGYTSEGDNFFKLWRDNLDIYSGCTNDNIGSKIYPVPSPEQISNFCDNDAVFLVSEKSLIEDKFLAKLYTLGIPFIMTTQKDEYSFTDNENYTHWKDAKLEEIKRESYKFINEMPEELHFLCDDGYSDAFLEAFQNAGKEYLGDEYE